MKKIKFIILYIICLGISQNVFSQDKAITNDEYNSVISNASPKDDKTAYRITSITNFYNGKKVESTRTLITENLPSDRKRTVFAIMKDGLITERTENITIGTIKYSKKDNNDWEKTDLTDPNSNVRRMGAITSRVESIDCREFYIINTTLDKESVDLYLSYHVSQNDKTLYFIDDRHWINKEGILLKSISKVSKIIPENVTSVSTRDYFYNPNGLKIEAPIIAEKTK